MLLPQKVTLASFQFFLVRNLMKFDEHVIVASPDVTSPYYVVSMTITAKNDKNEFWWISKCQHYIQHFQLCPYCFLKNL